MSRSRQRALYGEPAAPAPAPGPPGLTRPRAEVTAQLQERSDRGKELQARQIQSHSDMEAYNNDAQKWREYNSALLGRLFTSEAIQKEYLYSALPSRMARNEIEALKIRRETVDREIAKLKSIVRTSRPVRRSSPRIRIISGGSRAEGSVKGLRGSWPR